MKCPHCRATEGHTIVARYHYHRTVYGRVGRDLIAARTSTVKCGKCRWEWRTDARVEDIPDAHIDVRCCYGFTSDQQEAVIAAIEENPTGKLYPDWHRAEREEAAQ